MQGTKGKVDSPFTCDVIACLVWLGLALGGTNSLDLHGIDDDYLQTKNNIVKIIPHDSAGSVPHRRIHLCFPQLQWRPAGSWSCLRASSRSHRPS